jgi:hypothetical protein
MSRPGDEKMKNTKYARNTACREKVRKRQSRSTHFIRISREELVLRGIFVEGTSAAIISLTYLRVHHKRPKKPCLDRVLPMSPVPE